MATPHNEFEQNSNGRDWEKLSPAISHSNDGGSVNADRLLSARRGERQNTEVEPSDAQGIEAEATPESVTPAEPDHSGKPAAESAPWGEPQENTDEHITDSVKAVRARSFSTIAEQEDEANRRAEAREIAVADRPKFLKLRAVIMALAVPLTILALAIRTVSSSAFLWLEYHRPGFPADDYGFTTDERMTYGSYGIHYILNFAPSSFLSSLHTAHGSKLFLESEVGHMTDVKHLMLIVMAVATALFLLALLCSRSLRVRAPGVIQKSIFAGAILTLVLMVALGVLGALGWESFFTNFHHLLFPQGNWTFRRSDTLIRLYPPQFWVDAALAVAAITLVLTVLAMFLSWPTKFRRALARKRADERLELRRRLTH